MKLVAAASYLLVAILGSATSTATVYECPLPDTPPLVVQTQTATSGTGNGAVEQLSLSTVVPSVVVAPEKDFLCLLSLLVPSTAGSGNASIRKPVARSYGGRAWEVKAGPFAETIAPPVCDGDGSCLLTLPFGKYGAGVCVLTSYLYGEDAR